MGAANTTFTLEFFIADANGQGKTFLGSTTLTADGNGRVAINAILNMSTTSSQSIVATAIDPTNNTSEFSNSVAVNTAPTADLSITNTDNVTSAVPGASVVYTIVASNAGPGNAIGSTITDTFPAAITAVSWTASVSAGSHLSATSGTGNISLTADLLSGGKVTITAFASISATASGTLSNTATVTAPAAVTDPTANNTATDTDTLVAGTPMTFTVINTNGSGSGSLAQAILDSNANAGLNTITFAIPTSDPGYQSATGTFLIAPSSDLPTITNPVIIDGTSQSGYAGTPLIELSGVNLTVGGHNGLTLGASGSTIEGLAINSFTSNGIEIDGQSDDVIQGDFLGTNVLGTTALGNGNDGLFLNAASGNQIGGTTFTTASGTFSARNLVAGNHNAGVWVSGDRNVLQGNLIGTNLTGTAALPNLIGVLVSGNNNLIGGVGGLNGGHISGAGNLISGNSEYGVAANPGGGSGSANVISGNFIGTDVTGSLALGNGTTGAADFGVFLLGETGDTIGGTLPGTGNVISGNVDGGFLLQSSTGNQIVGNFIGTNAAGKRRPGECFGGPDDPGFLEQRRRRDDRCRPQRDFRQRPGRHLHFRGQWEYGFGERDRGQFPRHRRLGDTCSGQRHQRRADRQRSLGKHHWRNCGGCRQRDCREWHRHPGERSEHVLGSHRRQFHRHRSDGLTDAGQSWQRRGDYRRSVEQSGVFQHHRRQRERRHSGRYGHHEPARGKLDLQQYSSGDRVAQQRESESGRAGADLCHKRRRRDNRRRDTAKHGEHLVYPGVLLRLR